MPSGPDHNFRRCFLVYDDRVDVLAITGSKQRIDHSMSPDEACTLWADLCQCGWHHASEEKITRYQMSHRKLRSIVWAGRLDHDSSNGQPTGVRG
jgi:hypothetical protein